ncbi:MAG: hypothetical protein ACREAA_14675 [Candidatus Polarisedimenticolia bacterium]
MMTAWILVLAAAAATATPADVPEPEAPRARVETEWPGASSRTLEVPAGASLQEALDRARPGDEIVLQAGAEYRGPFTLPAREGSGWIVVRTSDLDGLPKPGGRASECHAHSMARLVASRGSVVTAEPRAHHYRLVGLEIAPTPGTFLFELVTLGAPPHARGDEAHHIIIDRCYLHGDPAKGTRRGVALHSSFSAVIDSTLVDFKEVGADSQAIAGWAGPGPYRIANNLLEAAGENVMFGGADPAMAGLVPADIEIQGNRLTKPLAWKADDPSYEGTAWSVKNLFELKNARRVLVEGNVFERNWAHAQNGFAILFTVRNQDGSAPWSTVEDVRFERNIVRFAGSGVNILGRDDAAPSGQAARIAIRHNLFTEIGGPQWGGAGILFQILNGARDLIIENNTAIHSGSLIMAEGQPNEGFTYRFNIAPNNQMGAVGTGTAPGQATLRRYFPGCRLTRNVIAGGAPRDYPPGNFFPPTLEAVRFVDLRGHRYRLSDSSPFRNPEGGETLGLDVPALCAALSASDRPETCKER